MRRIMCISCPQLPLDRYVRRNDPRTEGVFAIIRDIKNAFRLTHVSAAARQAGLSAGLTVPDARAIAPDLLTEPADPVREGLLLTALARWAGSLSPWVAHRPPDIIWVDITGCAHLFGGEDAMAAHTRARLTDMNITCHMAIADTKGAATALARYAGAAYSRAEPGQTAAAVAKLPVAALGIPDKLSHDLQRLGLTTIEHLKPFKSAELARRFGLDLPQAQAKLLGHMPDPVIADGAAPVFAARMNLPTPIGLKDDIDAVLDKLVTSVCTRLEKAQMGARRFNLTIRCVDTGDHVLSIGFARPSHDAAAIKRQFEHPLNNFRLEFGADWFRLIADGPEPLQIRQSRIVLNDNDNMAERDLDFLVSTLGNRLGFDRVRKFIPRDSHLPEKAFGTVEAIRADETPVWPDEASPRPLRLFRPEPVHVRVPGRPPKAFDWRGQRYEAVAVQGPERLYPEWWSDQPDAVRDYWAVSTQAGERLWLLTFPQGPKPDWYVAGRFV